MALKFSATTAGIMQCFVFAYAYAWRQPEFLITQLNSVQQSWKSSLEPWNWFEGLELDAGTSMKKNAKSTSAWLQRLSKAMQEGHTIANWTESPVQRIC